MKKLAQMAAEFQQRDNDKHQGEIYDNRLRRQAREQSTPNINASYR